MDVSALRPGLERLARSRGLPPEDAEDLAQATVVRLLGVELDHGRDPEAYAVRSLLNAICDHRRRAAIRPLCSPIPPDWEGPTVEPPPPGDPRAEIVLLLLRSLSSSERTAMELHARGLSYAEAASASSSSVSAHRSRLTRARARLRALARGVVHP